MSFLRVVSCDGDEMTYQQFEGRDAIIGTHLRNSPDCIRAKAAKSGGTTLIVSEWTDEAAFQRESSSVEWETALRDRDQVVAPCRCRTVVPV